MPLPRIALSPAVRRPFHEAVVEILGELRDGGSLFTDENGAGLGAVCLLLHRCLIPAGHQEILEELHTVLLDAAEDEDLLDRYDAAIMSVYQQNGDALIRLEQKAEEERVLAVQAAGEAQLLNERERYLREGQERVNQGIRSLEDLQERLKVLREGLEARQQLLEKQAASLDRREAALKEAAKKRRAKPRSAKPKLKRK